MRRLRTIYTVMRKDIILMMRYPTWIIQDIIWPLIFPLLYILSAMGFAGPDRSGLEVFKAAAGTELYEGFIMIGTMMWMWVNVTMWSFGSYLREEQMLGTLESNWLCPINRFDFLVGAALVSAIQGLFMSAVSVIEYRFIYGVHFTGGVLLWFLTFLIMVPAVYGVGMLFSSLILWAKEVSAAVNLVRGLIMILCGITFPITVMPGVLQGAAKLIPFTYGISAARQLMVNGSTLSAASYNISMCLLGGMIFLVAGRLVFGFIEGKVKNSGSLERF